jgi:hypothetical protein
MRKMVNFLEKIAEPGRNRTVYAHWLPEASAIKAVDLLDETQPAATPAQPRGGIRQAWNALSAFGRMVSQDGIEPSTRRLRVCCSAN